MNETLASTAAPFSAEGEDSPVEGRMVGRDGDGVAPLNAAGDAPVDEDTAVITRAIRALVAGPGGAGPVDRIAEARTIEAVAARVNALLASDPAALRRRLAQHAELANALALIYAQRAAAASAPGVQATFAGISLRAMATGSRLLALLGASAPPPPPDGAARPRLDGDNS